MIFEPRLFGWIIWWLVAANATLLFLWLAVRIITWQPLGRILPWMTLALTLLAVWFFVIEDWNTIHLAWLYPTISVVVPIVAFIASVC
jgi:hypothetical protein